MVGLACMPAMTGDVCDRGSGADQVWWWIGGNGKELLGFFFFLFYLGS